MRPGCFGQGEALVDLDADVAALDQAEQLVGHRLEFFRGIGVAAQGRPGHVQRTLLREDAQVDPGHRPRGVAEADQQAARRHAVQRGFPGILAHRVVDHRALLPVGQFEHPPRHVLMAIVDGLPGTVLPGQARLFRRADGADQLHSKGLGPLAGEQAHAARGGMEENGFAAPQFVGLAQQVLGGEPLEHHRGGLFEVDAVGQVDQLLLRQHMQFAVGAQRAGGVGDAVADLETGHFAAHRLDLAGTFATQSRG